VSNNKFISAQLSVKMGRFVEAIKYMQEALDIFESSEQDVELKRSRDDMLLIKVRYFSSFANIYYLEGTYPLAKAFITRALDIAGNTDNYSYQSAAEFKKLAADLKHVELRCDARLAKQSAIDLRPEGQRIEVDVPVTAAKVNAKIYLKSTVVGVVVGTIASVSCAFLMS
jgi:tetratricopeptide (TPR) repeat protein